MKRQFYEVTWLENKIENSFQVIAYSIDEAKKKSLVFLGERKDVTHIGICLL